MLRSSLVPALLMASLVVRAQDGSQSGPGAGPSVPAAPTAPEADLKQGLDANSLLSSTPAAPTSAPTSNISPPPAPTQTPHPQSAPPSELYGEVEGNMYVAPGGLYKIKIPVLAPLGGTITDTPNVVTFQDAFTTHLSIGAYKQDATQHWLWSTEPIKDYLIDFFKNYVYTDFRRVFHDQIRLEPNGLFLPQVMNGSFIVYVLLPGGTMFANDIRLIDANEKPRVAKRGNLMFVRNGTIYVISSELGERVTEGSAYHVTSDAEDKTLRARLLNVASQLVFPPAPAASAAAPGSLPSSLAPSGLAPSTDGSTVTLPPPAPATPAAAPATSTDGSPASLPLPPAPGGTK